jgi:hypothetical protein
LLVRRGPASGSAPAAYYCGLLLLLQDPKDPFQGMYDEEIVLLLTDQSNISGEVELEKLQNVRLQPIDAAGTTITGQPLGVQCLPCLAGVLCCCWRSSVCIEHVYVYGSHTCQVFNSKVPGGGLVVCHTPVVKWCEKVCSPSAVDATSQAQSWLAVFPHAHIETFSCTFLGFGHPPCLHD